MLKFFKLVVVLSFLITLIGCGTNPDKDNSPPEPVPVKETEHALVQAKKALALLEKDAENILFVDVRTTGEVERGVPTLLDVNVPYQLLLKTQKENGEGFESGLNNDFVDAIEERLEEKDLDKLSTIILICQLGNRSAMAAKALAKIGYKNVSSVDGGFIAWKKTNLPWTTDIPIGIFVLDLL